MIGDLDCQRRNIDNLSAVPNTIALSHLFHDISCFQRGENSFRYPTKQGKMQLFMPVQGYYEAMAFTSQEWENPQLLNHIFHGLRQTG